MKAYASLADAVHDAHLLSSAMTRKFAVCSVPLGGGKSVIAVPTLPAGGDRAALFREFGDLVESLGGVYAAAPDMNTSDADMDVIGERTRHVFCRTPAAGGAGTTAPATADGVYFALRAAVAHAFRSGDPRGRVVLVQGVGAVGARLAARLAADGAEVVVCDVDEGRAADLASRIGARSIPRRRGRRSRVTSSRRAPLGARSTRPPSRRCAAE